MKDALLIFVPALLIIAAISYLLALAGEPQAAWFWRDVLGLL